MQENADRTVKYGKIPKLKNRTEILNIEIV